MWRTFLSILPLYRIVRRCDKHTEVQLPDIQYLRETRAHDVTHLIQTHKTKGEPAEPLLRPCTMSQYKNSPSEDSSGQYKYYADDNLGPELG